MQLIAITGATGFIGQRLLQMLVESSAAALRIDLRAVERGALDAVLRDNAVNCLVHFASPAPSADPAAQDDIEQMVVDLAEGVAAAAADSGTHVILASTIRVHPLDSGRFSAATPVAPFDGYGRGKARVEKLVADLVGAGGGCTILRISSVQGIDSSGRARGLLGLFGRQAAAGRLTVMGNGGSIKDLIHVDDVALAVMAAVDSAATGVRTIHIGSGEGCTVIDVVQQCKAEVERRGRTLRIEHIGADPNDLAGVVDVSDAWRVLGWRPRVGIEEMISEALDCCLPNGLEGES